MRRAALPERRFCPAPFFLLALTWILVLVQLLPDCIRYRRLADCGLLARPCVPHSAPAQGNRCRGTSAEDPGCGVDSGRPWTYWSSGLDCPAQVRPSSRLRRVCSWS